MCGMLNIFMNKVDVYILDTQLIKNNFEFVLNFVSEERKIKVLKFVQEKDQLLSLGAGYLIKKNLPLEDIVVSRGGKPYIKGGPFFNISHSGEYVIMVVHKTREVGVDIERINESKLDAIKYVLSDKEKSVIDTNTLFLMWSNKESLTKCLSTGIQDIKIVSGLPLEGVRTINGEKYFTRSLIHNNYSLSVTLKGSEPFRLVIKPISNLEE